MAEVDGTAIGIDKKSLSVNSRTGALIVSQGALTENEKAAINLIQRANPAGISFRSGGEFNSNLDGSIVFVEFQDKDKNDCDACVFIGKDRPPITLEADQYARRIRASLPSTFWRMIASPASFSGFIALIITLTISAIVLFHGKDNAIPKVPSVLTAPLAVIVGFYFSRYAFARTSQIREEAKKAMTDDDPTVSDLRVVGVVTGFLNGDLAIVNCTKNGIKDWENYVHITADDVSIYEDKKSLGELFQSYRPPTLWQMIASVTTFGGAIAVIICLTLCILVWNDPSKEDPVPVLGTSLTTILAFYFGTQSTKN